MLGSADSDAQSFKKGSAQIALEVDPTFDCFIFIEKDAGRAGELQALRRQFPNRTAAIRIEQDDANTFLESWCRQAGFWKNHRAVVLLDPYGMQVDWKTVEAIAATRAIDLWYLFPLGVAVNRLLTQTSPPPEKWANALTRILGTPDWQEVFYPRQEVTTLFGSEESQSKAVTLDNVGEFFVNRLKTIFAKVAENPLQLRNSRGNPIYLLCFAAGNPKGATTAVKIAQDILGLQAGC